MYSYLLNINFNALKLPSADHRYTSPLLYSKFSKPGIATLTLIRNIMVTNEFKTSQCRKKWRISNLTNASPLSGMFKLKTAGLGMGVILGRNNYVRKRVGAEG